jgi:hypothetical protein
MPKEMTVTRATRITNASKHQATISEVPIFAAARFGVCPESGARAESRGWRGLELAGGAVVEDDGGKAGSMDGIGGIVVVEEVDGARGAVGIIGTGQVAEGTGLESGMPLSTGVVLMTGGTVGAPWSRSKGNSVTVMVSVTVRASGAGVPETYMLPPTLYTVPASWILLMLAPEGRKVTLVQTNTHRIEKTLFVGCCTTTITRCRVCIYVRDQEVENRRLDNNKFLL